MYRFYYMIAFLKVIAFFEWHEHIFELYEHFFTTYVNKCIDFHKHILKCIVKCRKHFIEMEEYFLYSANNCLHFVNIFKCEVNVFKTR